MNVRGATTGIFLIWLFFPNYSPPLLADGEGILPRIRHYEMQHQGRECSIYRSLARKARYALHHNQELTVRVGAVLQQRRQALELCARGYGISIRSDRDEIAAAEVCSKAYREWLSPGARLEIARQDLQEAKASLALMQSRIDGKCGHLREPIRRYPVVPRKG